MATCSFAGFLFGPRVRRSSPSVAATPPPDVTTPLLQSTLDLLEELPGAAALAALISAGLKRTEVVIGVLAVCIAAGNQMRGVVASRGPYQEDNPTLPHSQTLQSELSVAFAIIFH